MNREERAAFLRTFLQFTKLYQAVQRPVVARLNAESGIEPGMFAVLVYLHDAGKESDGAVPLAKLYRLMRTRYSQPGLSRLIKRMEVRGLLKRSGHPTDGRATILALTRSGHALYDRSVHVYQDALYDFFGCHLTASEVGDLSDLLAKLIDRVGIT